MVQSLLFGGINFVVSGNRSTEVLDYLYKLSATSAFSTQTAFIGSQGFKNVVISSDPNDMPTSIRARMYDDVYNQTFLATKIEIAGVTVDAPGSSTAYILLNNAIGVDDSGKPRGIAAVAHEIYHIGYKGTAGHPAWWSALVNTQLDQIDHTLSSDARAYQLHFDHSSVPKPILNVKSPQTAGITTHKDEPIAVTEHIDFQGGVIDESVSVAGQVTDLSFFTYDPSTAIDFRKLAIPQLYETLLGRDPDAAGLNYWMNNGATLQSISTTFMASPEFHLRQDISAVYQTSLGRPIDNDTLNTYVNNGLTATQVKADIEGSLAYREHIITQDFETMLNREPDAAGLNWYVTSKLTLDQIAKTIQDSSEYHQLHPATPTSLVASGKFVDVPTIFKPVEITQLPDFVAAPISVVNVSDFYTYVDVMHPVDYFPSLTNLINSIKNSPSYQQTPSYADPLDFSTPLTGPRVQIWDAASGSWYP